MRHSRWQTQDHQRRRDHGPSLDLQPSERFHPSFPAPRFSPESLCDLRWFPKRKGGELRLKIDEVDIGGDLWACHRLIWTGLGLARASARISAILTYFSSTRRALSFFSAAWNRRERRETSERKGKLGYGSFGRWSYRFGLCGRLGVVDGALVARSLTLLGQLTV